MPQFMEAAERFRLPGAGARHPAVRILVCQRQNYRDALPDPSWRLAGLIFLGMLASWLMIVGLLGYGRHYLDRTSPALAYLAEGSYPVYILHQTVIVVIAFYVVGMPGPEPLQWLALLAVVGGRARSPSTKACGAGRARASCSGCGPRRCAHLDDVVFRRSRFRQRGARGGGDLNPRPLLYYGHQLIRSRSASRGSTMRRISLTRSLSTLVVLGLLALGLLALAPVAGAALPPAGDWAWTTPYAPVSGPHAFRAATAGPGFSFYTAGDDWSGQWIVNRVDTGADSEGSTYWTDTRTGPDGNGASASFLATDRTKNLYVVGQDKTHGGDIFLVKYSPAGAVLWQKSWDGPAHLDDWPQGLAVTAGGTVFIAGRIGKTAGYDDAVLLKYSAAGRLLWKYVMATTLYDSFEGVAVDGTGNAYVTGLRNATVGSSTMVTLKVDPNGHKVWQRSIAGLGIYYSGEFIKLKGTAVYVAGTLNKWATWPVVAKYSLAGKRAYAWTPGGYVDSVDDMTVDAKGRVVLIGTFGVNLGGGDDITTSWVDVLAADGSDRIASGMYYADYGVGNRYPIFFHDVAVDADGSIYCAGEWRTNAASTEGNALVARIPSPDAGLGFSMDKIWRFDGQASGIDSFWGLMIKKADGTYAVGTEWTGTGAKAFAHRIQP